MRNVTVDQFFYASLKQNLNEQQDDIVTFTFISRIEVLRLFQVLFLLLSLGKRKLSILKQLRLITCQV